MTDGWRGQGLRVTLCGRPGAERDDAGNGRDSGGVDGVHVSGHGETRPGGRSPHTCSPACGTPQSPNAHLQVPHLAPFTMISCLEGQYFFSGQGLLRMLVAVCAQGWGMCGRPAVARRDRAPPVQQIVEESVSRSIQWAPSPPPPSFSPEIGGRVPQSSLKFTSDGEQKPHTTTLYIPAPLTAPAPITVMVRPLLLPSPVNNDSVNSCWNSRNCYDANIACAPAWCLSRFVRPS